MGSYTANQKLFGAATPDGIVNVNVGYVGNVTAALTLTVRYAIADGLLAPIFAGTRRMLDGWGAEFGSVAESEAVSIADPELAVGNVPLKARLDPEERLI